MSKSDAEGFVIAHECSPDNTGHEEKAPCGRPLGLAFDTIGDNLIVMHSHHGVFEVDLKSGSKKQLVSEADVIGKAVRSDRVR